MTDKEIRNLFGDNEEQYKDFLEKFHGVPQVKELTRQIQMLQRSGRYFQSISLQKKLDAIAYNVAKELIEEANKKEEHITLAQVELTDKERQEIVDLRICLDILSDCMETCAMEINDILKRHDKTLSFEDYKPTIDLLREAKRHLAWCSDNFDYRKYEPWGEECDKFTRMVRNKANKIKRETRKEALSKTLNTREEETIKKEE